MANNPAIVEEAITDITNAWTQLAPAATFAGMTFAQYQAAVKPSLDARTTITGLEEQMTSAITNRDKMDVTSESINQKVVKAVVGDVNYGDDSALYEAMGYIRKSQRKTGLSRKSKTAAAKAPAK
jgi:hypothetical protein